MSPLPNAQEAHATNYLSHQVYSSTYCVDIIDFML